MTSISIHGGQIPIQPSRFVQQLKLNGAPVLRISCCLPRLVSDSRGARRINRYYRQLSDAWRSRWTGVLYTRACAAQKAALAEGASFSPWEATLDYTLTLQTPEVLSLTWQVEEKRSGVQRAQQHGDTWSLLDGSPLPLRGFLPGGRRWKHRLLEEISNQMAARTASGEPFRPDSAAMLRRYFQPEQFFLTPEGVTVWFAPDTLAAPSAGAPRFSFFAAVTKK